METSFEGCLKMSPRAAPFNLQVGKNAFSYQDVICMKVSSDHAEQPRQP
jgi:hypothetical protein